jgi:hypothetical protein
MLTDAFGSHPEYWRALFSLYETAPASTSLEELVRVVRQIAL